MNIPVIPTKTCLGRVIGVIAGVIVLCISAQPQSATRLTPPSLTKRLIGDYGYWSKYQTPPYGSAQIPYSKLTHIIHFGPWFDSSATLYIPGGFLEPELILKAHAAHDKVMVGIGGDFSALDGNPTLISTLAGNIWAFIVQNGYDGVDLDWEYPVPSEAETFHELIAELRALLPAPEYAISADVPPWGGEGTGYDLTGVQPMIDYFNIMMYDCAGPWTQDGQLNSEIFWDSSNPDPWECQPGGSADEAITIFTQEHVLPAKLNLGTPFYGYYYTNVTALWGECSNASHTKDGDCDNTVVSENYGTFLKQRINQKGWQSFYDQTSLVPYMLRRTHGRGFITYDDANSTYDRIWYADWERNLGGTFMWSLDADYDGQSQDLLDAMYRASLKQAQ